MLIFPLILVVILFFQNLFEENRIKTFLFSLFWGFASTIWATYLCGLVSKKFTWMDLFTIFPVEKTELIYFIYIIVTGCVYFILYFLHRETEYYEEELYPATVFEKIVTFWLFVCYQVALLLIFSSNWAMNHFKGVSIDQIVYTLVQPLEGTDDSQINSFIQQPLLGSLAIGLLTFFIFYIIAAGLKKANRRGILKVLPFPKVVMTILSAVVLIFGFMLSVNQFGYAEVKAYFFEKTKIYDEEYVNPKKVKVTFPEKKRNLIYIYLESMETTYLSKDVGGAMSENLLPNFTKMIENNQAMNFSNTNQIGGALPIKTTSFTVGGMVAQTSGLPVKVALNADNQSQTDLGNEANSFGANTSDFLPGAYSLGEILEDNGYTNTLLLGSNAAFSGRDKYFTEHGNYRILDYNTALTQKWIPEGYHVWWGYEDEKLLDIAKKMLTETANQGKPFNFTMLTADTHFEDGYLSPNAPRLFKDQYANVIHFSDQMLSEFIQWIQEQPFYEDTTIILSGDHLSMDQDFFNDVPDSYQRTIFDMIINSPITSDRTKNRQFTSFDLYPTTLAALGVQIEGDQLGLGVNLYSDKKTLAEKLGYEYFDNEMSKRSSYYDNKLLKKNEVLSSTTQK